MRAPNGPHILVLAVWINYIPLRTIAILINHLIDSILILPHTTTTIQHPERHCNAAVKEDREMSLRGPMKRSHLRQVSAASLETVSSTESHVVAAVPMTSILRQKRSLSPRLPLGWTDANARFGYRMRSFQERRSCSTRPLSATRESRPGISLRYCPCGQHPEKRCIRTLARGATIVAASIGN